MTTFPELTRALSEVDGNGLTLPIRGKQYTFSASLPLSVGLRLIRTREALRVAAQEGRTATQADVDGSGDHEFYSQMMGDTRAELERDGVTLTEFGVIGETLLAWHLAGEDSALRVWQQNIAPTAGDDVPPGDTAGSASNRPTTSRNGSTSKRSPSSSPRTSRGRKSSTSGGSSSPTSTGSTASS